MDPAGSVVNTKQCAQGKRLFFRGLTLLCRSTKALSAYRYIEKVSFLLKQLPAPLSVVRLVVLLLGGAMLLSGCTCGSVANNEVALGLCQFSKQF